ncbi:serine hydrolase domain-containing protein [Roseimarinus sediminis]|uniref:serine hydrolase domain-containing protein n=1 Tax=Roseimarinus sediminis TaxID=1610899 RepID=UPI003D1AD28A
MKKVHILFSLLVSELIVLVIVLKIYLLGGKHLSPYLSFILLLIVSAILIFKNQNKRKMLLLCSFYLTGYVIIMLFLFRVFHWPNHDKEFIRVNNNYTSYSWQTAEPKEDDFNTERLSYILANAKSIKNLQSVLVVKDKKLIVEQYFHGCNQFDAFNIFSMTQTVISSLIGIAIDQGIIGSEKDKMINYFPAYRNQKYISDKKNITIENLLTNQAWLNGNENESSFNSFNWIKSTLKRPRNNKKGIQYFQQQTGHLLSGIITEVSGKSTKKYAEEYLCKPLGIRIINWFQSPGGIYRGSNTLYLTSRDIARFGDLYLSNGKLNGKQILSKKWIDKSLTRHIEITLQVNKDFLINGVGYSWITGTIHNKDVYIASDLNGVFIINIPSEDITIVTTRYKIRDYKSIESLICDIVSTIK